MLREHRAVHLHQLRLPDRRARLLRRQIVRPLLQSKHAQSRRDRPARHHDDLVPRCKQRRDLTRQPLELPRIQRGALRVRENAGAEFEDDAQRGLGHWKKSAQSKSARPGGNKESQCKGMVAAESPAPLLHHAHSHRYTGHSEPMPQA